MATMVIFGASGDLTKRKLIPALFQLHLQGRLPKATRIVGMSRSDYSHEQWREQLAESTRAFAKGLDESQWAQWEAFAEAIFYHRGDVNNAEDFAALDAFLTKLESEAKTDGAIGNADDALQDRVYYLATMPQLYSVCIKNLGAARMADEASGQRRVVIEKPFGVDLGSAKKLNSDAHEVFREDQIYRIDHYLGKETVQNLMALRFANTIFEPIWNRNYIDHVQITVAEEVPVGSRGGYYDTSGVLRDMFQNHLLQLMMLTAMDAPVKFNSNDVRDEKVKVLRAIRPLRGADFASDTFRAQYDGYLDEPGVPKDSQTPTFAVVKLHVDSWRWQGVPFYLRSGKAMSCRSTQIVIQFRDVPHLLFGDRPGAKPQANRLLIQVQPAEGLELQIQTKVPDAGMRLRMTDLDYAYSQDYAKMPDAYQRLLMDALSGDASLFARSDEVELAWSVIDPIHAAWESPAAPCLHTYPKGYWGPDEVSQWMQSQGRQWFDVCPVLYPDS